MFIRITFQLERVTSTICQSGSVGSIKLLQETSINVKFDISNQPQANSWNIDAIIYNKYQSKFYCVAKIMRIYHYSHIFQTDVDFTNYLPILTTEVSQTVLGNQITASQFDISQSGEFLAFCGAVPNTLQANPPNSYGYIFIQKTASNSPVSNYFYSNVTLFHTVKFSKDNLNLIAIGRDTSDNGLLCFFANFNFEIKKCFIYQNIFIVSGAILSGSSDLIDLNLNFYYNLFPFKSFNFTHIKYNTTTMTLSNWVWVSQMNYDSMNSQPDFLKTNIVVLEQRNEICILMVFDGNKVVLLFLSQTTGLPSRDIFVNENFSGATLINDVYKMSVEPSSNILYILVSIQQQSIVYTFDLTTSSFGNVYKRFFCTTSYTSTSCTPSFSSNQVSKSSCLSSPNQFTSKLSYFQNLSFTVFVQSGKSKTEAFIEPCFISSSTDNVIFSIPLSFAWVNYNRQKGEVIFNGPNTLNADFMNFTVPLIRISSNMENLAVYYYVKVYSCKVTNCDTCDKDSRSSCTICKKGYNLNSNNTQCIIPQTVKMMTTSMKYFAGASIAASAATSNFLKYNIN